MKKQSFGFPLFMLAVSIFLAHEAARAEGAVELMCKNKAKEIALQTYSNCVTEEKTTRLKDIKERYKARMSEVKDQFQRELNDLNGGAAKSERTPKAEVKPQAKARATRPGRAERPVSGIATALPAKQNDNGPAMSLQASMDAQTVVTPAALDADGSVTENVPAPEVVEVSE